MKTLPATVAAVAALDQATKIVALRSLADGGSVRIVPGYFDLRLVMNRGAAWGMLAGRRALLVAVSAGMLALLWTNRRELAATRMGRISSGLLAGGIVGNLVDRAFRGEVVDFLDFHVRDVWAWPTFNVADSAICVGVVLLLATSCLPWFRARR